MGSTVTIKIAGDHPAPQEDVRVPIGSLLDAGKGPGVWVITGEPAKVSWCPVAIHEVDDDGARVAGHLKQGDLIVALGAHLLREGEPVRVVTDVATAAGTAP